MSGDVRRGHFRPPDSVTVETDDDGSAWEVHRWEGGCPAKGSARPAHYDELRDRVCPGTTHYEVGDFDAPCDTCGGRTGWMVAGPIEVAS